MNSNSSTESRISYGNLFILFMTIITIVVYYSVIAQIIEAQTLYYF